MEALLIVGGVILAGLGVFVYIQRSRQILERWAKREKVELVHVEHRWFRKGPYTLRSGDHHAVFYVTVMTGEGDLRAGYVRVGSFITGLFSDQAVVSWEK